MVINYEMRCIILLFPHAELSRQAYGFQYLHPATLNIQLMNIGWEYVNRESYYWDGFKRGKGRRAIFQYTLSGKGKIRYGDQLYHVPKDHGFLCTVPGDNAYYFEEQDEHWDFLYILVRGEDALRHWASLIEKCGPVISFQDRPEVPMMISSLYANIYKEPQLDKYMISSELYRFVMEMHRLVEERGVVKMAEFPDSIRRAIDLMQSRYAFGLTLDDLAVSAGLSKYYFCRLFVQKTGLQPIQYLRKIRIERAAWMLRNGTDTIEKIAQATGFDNGNYFIKVFKTLVGVTPSDYRNGQSVQPAHFLRIEK